MKHTVILLLIAAVDIFSASFAQQSSAQSLVVMQETSFSSDGARSAVFRAGTDRWFGFLRLKKNSNAKSLPLDLRTNVTTQDFAVRSFGFRYPFGITGAIRYRGFVAELRNPLFSSQNPLGNTLQTGLIRETAIYTAATSFKYLGTALAAYAGPFLLQVSAGLAPSGVEDATSDFVDSTGSSESVVSVLRHNLLYWGSVQYAFPSTRSTAEFFIGTHSQDLPRGKKWEQLYPDFGSDTVLYPAVKYSFARMHTTVSIFSATELCVMRIPQWLVKLQYNYQKDSYKVYGCLYKSSSAMRNFTGTFPGRDFQFVVNPQIGNKRYRGGVLLYLYTKTEDTINEIVTLGWHTAASMQFLPPKYKIRIETAIAGLDGNLDAITIESLIQRRNFCGFRNSITAEPSIQWKQSFDELFRLYSYQCNIAFSSAVGNHLYLSFGLKAGTWNLKTKPYSFIEPSAELSTRFKGRNWTTEITAEYSEYRKIYQSVTDTSKSSSLFSVKIRLEEKMHH